MDAPLHPPDDSAQWTESAVEPLPQLGEMLERIVFAQAGAKLDFEGL